jgi:hypothetical protein
MTLNDHLQLLPARVRKPPDECRANTAPSKFARHLRVHEADRAWESRVNRDRQATIHLELLSAAGGIVADGGSGGHGALGKTHWVLGEVEMDPGQCAADA